MNRTPPKYVRQILRQEAGFGCPLPECANPYLEWHHFDPPWHEREHHDHEGMIALCAEHHKKADAGAYTIEQLHEFKRQVQNRLNDIKGQFEWLRHRMLAVVGGNFYYETPIIFQFQNQRIIWFNRDDKGYLLLNLKMLTTSREPRLIMEDNFWMTKGNMSDFECPPSGKSINALYSNDDMLQIKFFELYSFQDIMRRYPDAHSEIWRIELPITAVEIHCRVGGTKLEFGPRWTRLSGQHMQNCVFSNCQLAINIG